MLLMFGVGVASWASPAVAAALLAGGEIPSRLKRHRIGSDLVSMSATFGVGPNVPRFVMVAADRRPAGVEKMSSSRFVGVFCGSRGRPCWACGLYTELTSERGRCSVLNGIGVGRRGACCLSSLVVILFVRLAGGGTKSISGFQVARRRCCSPPPSGSNGGRESVTFFIALIQERIPCITIRSSSLLLG